MHKITFNGTASDTLGVRIERSPRIIRPRRKSDVITIPGRNGDIVFMQDAWNNYMQPYEIFFGTGADLSAETAADAVSAWLHSASDYARLEDTFEPDIYRLAYYTEETEIENALTEYGRTTILFNCRPERFLKSGETATTISGTSGTISNPTGFASRPLIRVNCSGSGTITVANSTAGKTYTVSLSNISSYIYLDCDEQNAYRTSGDNQNNKVTITVSGEFPRLWPGSNTISRTGSVTSVVITPRWFRI